MKRKDIATLARPRATDKARASNEGDAFHVVWTARRCLRLLDPSSDLVAVTIEGQLDEPSSRMMAEGILKVDTAEYFGSEHFQQATRIAYQQLKYSPTRQNKPWPKSEIATTFRAFAKLFNGICDQHGDDAVSERTEFRLVTNRPVSSDALLAIEAIRGRPQAVGRRRPELAAFRVPGVTKKRVQAFAHRFHIDARQSGRPAQEWELTGDIARYLPGDDSIAPGRLCDMVRRRALLDDERPIRRLDVLTALNVPSEDRLLPAPASRGFRLPDFVVPRAQESAIRNAIIAADSPVVIHAPGGVGKSILALRLGGLMPEGSVTVTFDGFADGRYRDPSDPRHRHDHGLVQLANELALHGLCPPLIPSQLAKRDDYLSAFLHRLQVSSLTARQTSPDALVVIVIDAADNSQRAAELEGSTVPSFPRDLLRIAVPAGCRIVALARTERVDERLEPPPTVLRIALDRFSMAETASLLRSRFPEADNLSIEEFHRLTSANPRVQSHYLNSGGTLTHVLRRLGPVAMDVEVMISRQLESAIAEIRENHGAQEVDALCSALAVLPPLVPIRILSKATAVREELIHSFIADLGYALMELDGAVHFRDEPVDTWFQKQFGSTAFYARLVDALIPLANEPYVAAALPELMWHARRVDELMMLAASDDALPPDDPVERKRILLRRVQFALKAALTSGRWLDIVRLSLRAGEETAGGDRLAQLHFDNADLVAMLSGPTRAQEVVYRHQARQWLGANFAFGAAMLAGDQSLHGEAKSMLRCADEWLSHWARRPAIERKDQPVEDDEIAAMELARLRLHGSAAMVHQLHRWTSKRVPFAVGRMIVRRLIDRGEFELIDAITSESQGSEYLILAVAAELSEVGRIPLRRATASSLSPLLKKKLEVERRASWSSDDNDINEALVSLAEAAAQHLLDHRRVLKLLRRYMPPLPKWGMTLDHDQNRDLVLRSRCLEAALEGRKLDLSEVAPTEIAKAMAEKGDNQNVREFRETVGVLLPWYQLRAEIIAGAVENSSTDARVLAALDATRGGWGYGHREAFVANQLVLLWLDCLVRSGRADDATVTKLEDWIGGKRVFFYLPTLTKLARTCARCTPSLEAAYRFARRAKQIRDDERTDAAEMASDYVALCRAVLPLDASHAEAAAYFEHAQRAVGRFGDEIMERWQAIVSLAKRSETGGIPRPSTAYALSRVAEIISEQRPDHFDWSEIIVEIARLCPSSALAILRRWHDRGQGWLQRMLADLTMHLVRNGVLVPTIAAAFMPFGDEWSLPEFVQLAFEGEPRSNERRQILDVAVTTVAREGWWDTAPNLRRVVERYGITDIKLNEMSKLASEIAQSASTSRERPNSHRPEPDVDWDGILGSRSFLTSADIDAAWREIEKLRPSWPVKELFRRMQDCVPRGKEREHLESMASATELDAWKVVSALEEANEHWAGRLAASQAIRAAAIACVRQRAAEFLGSWSLLDRKLERLSEVARCRREDLVGALLQGASESIEHVTAGGFFALAQEACASISHAQALDALQFALSRVEASLDKDGEAQAVGDGLWRSELVPPTDIQSAVAGFVYAMLASPLAEDRWRAAHVVVMLCRFEQAEIISRLVSMLGCEVLPAFTGRGLPFYAWHARLYLLIAICRAAQEVPALLAQFTPIFTQLSNGASPHVLVRHFAANLALSIDDAVPQTLTTEVRRKLETVNDSPFPPKGRDESARTGWDIGSWGESKRFYFPMDFDRYWMGSLAEVFGLPYVTVAQRAEAWIIDRWGTQLSGRRVEDPRRSYRTYRNQDSSGRYDTYPPIDDYQYYLSYHSLFCVAGELLAESPVVAKRREEDEWREWLARRLLTRADGRWLADHRGEVPRSRRPWQRREGELPETDATSEWPWRILPEDFDDAIGLFPGTSTIIVDGDWDIVEGHLKESLDVSSALVSPETSLPLLRALQTADNLSDAYLPAERDHHEIATPRFKLSGWIDDWPSDPKLDRHDPIGGRVPWPGPGPGRRISRALGLKTTTDPRRWREGERVVLWQEIWGSRIEERRSEAKSSGVWLRADLDYLLRMLNRLDRSLIISARIRRENGRKETEEEESEYGHRYYKRFYVLDADGNVHTLYGSRSVRTPSCRSTEPGARQ